MFQGKMKAVTFSFDDSVTQDQRLIELFDRYGLKCTFNVSYGKLGVARGLIREKVTVAHVRPQAYEIPGIYRGHEVAGHALTHAHLTRLETDEEVIYEVEEDLKQLTALMGYPVQGMAYPCNDYDDRVVEILRNRTSARFARTTNATHNFDLQDDLFTFNPTVHHKEWEEMFRLANEFIELKPDTPKLFYIWGHAYELDVHNDWAKMEEFCKLISNRDDIFYGTNSQVFFGDE